MKQLSLFDFSSKPRIVNGKVCKTCKEEKPLDAFGNASGGNYKHSSCKACLNHSARVRADLRKIIPPPPADHRCPICDRGEAELKNKNNKKNKTVWCLDHDHETDKFRGYICHSCNRALGMFQDDPIILRKAIIYLDVRQ
jgi:hypothetical protein